MELSLNDVQVVKLTTGEELITMVRANHTETEYTLKYPMSTYPTQEGEYIFVPFCGIADTVEVVVSADKLVCKPLPLQEAFLEQYAAIVAAQELHDKNTSDVIVPESQGIVIPGQ
ncbi:hypothetical protein NVP2275O_367 [Vibrio phage 2.275.O._10N.286.54.E11]|nr:hypothetical protein NVP2275O_367 [Vibrio phage 2.275.O._10N.286.54.E11]